MGTYGYKAPYTLGRPLFHSCFYPLSALTRDYQTNADMAFVMSKYKIGVRIHKYGEMCNFYTVCDVVIPLLFQNNI